MAREVNGHYRRLARLAMQWFLEPEDGVYCDPLRLGVFQRIFDPEVLHFQKDVNRVLHKSLTWPEYVALVLVHRDGMTCDEAVRVASSYDPSWVDRRSDNFIALTEHKAGLALERAGMGDIRDYFRV